MPICWPRGRIDLAGLERVAGGKTFFWAGVYSDDMNDRTTLRTDLNVFADFEPKLPESYRAAPYLLLGNIQPALQKSVRAQMNGSELAGGDTMNYWIQDFRAELLATIAEWDFLLINDSRSAHAVGRKQSAPGRGQNSRHGAAHAGRSSAANTARFCSASDGHFIAPGYLLEEVFDPTGAGDCFAGGFIGYLAGRGIDRARRISIPSNCGAR